MSNDLSELHKLLNESNIDIKELVLQIQKQQKQNILDAAQAASSFQGKVSAKRSLPIDTCETTPAQFASPQKRHQRQKSNDERKEAKLPVKDLDDMSSAMLHFMPHLPSPREKLTTFSVLTEEQKVKITERTRYFVKSVFHETHRKDGVDVKIGFDQNQIHCGLLSDCNCEERFGVPHFYYSMKGLPHNFFSLPQPEQKTLTDNEKSENTTGGGECVVWRHEKNRVSTFI